MIKVWFDTPVSLAQWYGAGSKIMNFVTGSGPNPRVLLYFDSHFHKTCVRTSTQEPSKCNYQEMNKNELNQNCSAQLTIKGIHTCSQNDRGAHQCKRMKCNYLSYEWSSNS